MIFRKFIVGIVIALFLALSGCVKDMTIPVYFQIDSTDFTADYSTYGTASNKITDVWVTVNGTCVGAYELPALFPVLVSGKTKIQFSPGIMMNGLSTQRPAYPMYTTSTLTVDLKKDTIYKFHPSFTYEDYVKFAFKEDFEDAGLKFSAVENSPALEKTGNENEVFHYSGEINNYSGKINIVDTGSSFFEIVTNSTYPLIYTNTQYCFLEINYKMEVPSNDSVNLEIGIYANYLTGQIIQCPLIKVKQSSVWKKMYVNLSKTIHDQGAYMEDFTVYIKGTAKTGVNASYLFDNIKLIYIPY